MTEAVPEAMLNHLAALAPAAPAVQPEEVAAAIVFLAGDNARFIHFVTLAVEGAE